MRSLDIGPLFQGLVLLDKDGNRRKTHKDIVRGFKDDDDEIMCSLCDLAFTTQDSNSRLHHSPHIQESK